MLWNALTPDIVNRRFVLHVDLVRLDSAPGLDKDHRPKMADPSWQRDFRAWCGTEPKTALQRT